MAGEPVVFQFVADNEVSKVVEKIGADAARTAKIVESVGKAASTVPDALKEAREAIATVAGGAQTLGARFDSIASSVGGWVGSLAGIGGMFDLRETFKAVADGYGDIKRMKVITGQTVEEAQALTNAFRESGVQIPVAEQAMAILSGQVSRGKEETNRLNTWFKSMGVDISRGPTQSLLDMAQAATEGKVEVGEMVRQMGISRQDAPALKSLLTKGPQEIASMMEAIKKAPGHVTEATLAAYSTMQRSRRELKASWEGLVGTIYQSLLPALNSILKAFRAGLERIGPYVEKLGAFIAKNMGSIQKVIPLLVGGLGLQKILGGLGMGGIGKLAGKAVGLAGGVATKGLGATLLGGLPMALGAAGKGLGPIVAGFGKLALVGGVVGAVIAGIVIILSKSEALRAALGKIIDAVGKVLSVLMETIGKVVGRLADALAPVVDDIANAIIPIADMIADMVVQFAPLVDMTAQALGYILQASTEVAKLLGGTQVGRGILLGGIMPGIGWLAKKAGLGGGGGATQAQPSPFAGLKGQLGAGGLQPPKAPSLTQNFPGAKFEITQEFAEGFDPDRIAVVFGNDLARLGERRLVSGLSPVFGGR